MNKGLEIRLKKHQKQLKKRYSKEKQLNLCRFIRVKNIKTGRINGKLTFLGTEILDGLQIENKLYYINQNKELHYIFINKKGNKILIKYSENEIECFDKILIEKYNNFKGI